MLSSLVISLTIIIIGGSSSGFVLYLSYRTLLIPVRGIYTLSILLPIPEEQGGRRARSEQLRGSQLLAGLKP